MGTTNKDIKKLYGLSAGQCNICKKNLFDSDVHIGEMAHVIAKSPIGPRGEKLNEDIRDSYQNLVLLCANHHKEVDQNPEKYTIELLHNIKKNHEHQISLKLSTNDRKSSESVLNELFWHLGFTKLVNYFENLPDFFDIEFLIVHDVFSEFVRTNPHIYPFSDAVLQEKIEGFINPYAKVINFFHSGYQTDTGHIEHYRETNNAFLFKLNRRNLPYEYAKGALSQYNHDIKTMIAGYYDLVEFVRLNYKSVF